MSQTHSEVTPARERHARIIRDVKAKMILARPESRAHWERFYGRMEQLVLTGRLTEENLLPTLAGAVHVQQVRQPEREPAPEPVQQSFADQGEEPSEPDEGSEFDFD